MYEGVPQNILSLVSMEVQQQNPKSMSLMKPLVSMMMFSSLMSLWVTCLEWRYVNIPMSCLIILLASSSGSRLLFYAFK
jgi:hypothetical protein